MSKKKLYSVLAIILVIAAAAMWFVFELKSETHATTIQLSEAQTIIDSSFEQMAVTEPLKLINSKSEISAKELSYGSEKDILVKCEVKTPDVYSSLENDYDKYLSSNVKKPNSTMYKSALDFKMEFSKSLLSAIESAPIKTSEVTFYLYDTHEGIKLYASDEACDAAYGGVISVINDIKDKNTYKVAGSDVEREIESGNVNKGFIQCIELRRDTAKPDTSSVIGRWYNNIKKDFIQNFITHDRWKTILNGLGITLKLTLFALIIGIILGFIVAFVRCTYLKKTKHGIFLSFFNAVAEVYLTVIRGTPVVVQIMIIYFVIFMPIGIDKFAAAVICFGFNSGAYVAEIVRGGIMSIDNGQTEAGRSLGFNYIQTMYYIVFPQAFKAVLPALANEFVVLLKETSIAFYIGLGDLMYAGNAIRAATYSPFMPLVAVAIIYLVMVLALSKLVSLLERRLRNSER